MNVVEWMTDASDVVIIPPGNEWADVPDHVDYLSALACLRLAMVSNGLARAAGGRHVCVPAIWTYTGRALRQLKRGDRS
jgi:hypothetical protein